MDIGIKARIVNHNLYSTILGNYPNVNQFCLRNKLSPTEIGKYVNLKSVPTERIANKLSEILKLPPDFLFPEDLCQLVKNIPKTAYYLHKKVDYLPLEEADVKYISYDPFGSNNRIDKEGLYKAISTLDKRLQDMIKERFGLYGNEKSYEEIGEKHNICAERARSLIQKAIRQLRHPERGVKYLPL